MRTTAVNRKQSFKKQAASLKDAVVQSMIDSGIMNYGHFIINAVGKVEGNDFNYAYTVGMTNQNLPEILFASPLPEKDMQYLLNEAVKLLPGMLDDLSTVFEIGDYDVNDAPGRFKWMALDRHSARSVAKDFMQHANNRYGLKVLTAQGIYQLLGPDDNNVLPGEAGYDQKFAQPVFIVA